MVGRRVLLVCVGLLVALPLAMSPVAAQALPPRFELRVSDAQATAPLPVDGTSLKVPVAWTLTCLQAGPAPEAALPAQKAELTLTGPDLPFQIVASDATVAFPDCVVTTAQKGEFTLSLAAVPGARAEILTDAGLNIVLAQQDPIPPVSAKSILRAAVAWHDDLNVTTPILQATAGPQKEVRFPITLRAVGNALAEVRFEVVGEVPAGWSPIPPVPIILDPKDGDRTVLFLVSTPHQNGGNHGSADFHLRVSMTSARDPALKAEPIEIPFNAQVSGLYVAGPSPAFLALAFVVAALLGSRRRGA